MGSRRADLDTYHRKTCEHKHKGRCRVEGLTHPKLVYHCSCELDMRGPNHTHQIEWPERTDHHLLTDDLTDNMGFPVTSRKRRHVITEESEDSNSEDEAEDTDNNEDECPTKKAAETNTGS